MNHRFIIKFVIPVIISCSRLPDLEPSNWDIGSFGSEMDEYATCLLLAESNTFWVGGFRLVASDFSSILLTRVRDFKPDIHADNDPQMNARIYGISSLKQNGNMVVTGYKRKTSEILVERDPLLACYNNMGELVWLYTDDSISDDVFWNTAINADSEIVAVGQRKSSGPLNYLPLVARFKNDGSLISARAYDIQTQSGAVAAISIETGYLMALTETVSAGESVYTEMISLAAINLEKDSISVYRLTEGVARCMTEINGGFVVGGNIRKTGVVRLICIDMFGNQKWNFQYGELQNEYYFELTAIVSDYNDSAAVILGNARYRNGSGSSIFMVKISAAGTICWERMYRGENEVKGFGIARLQDAPGFVICGAINTHSKVNHDIYLLKVDGEGTIERPAEPFSVFFP